VCDLLSYRNKYGREDSLAVLKNYLRREVRNIDKLIVYSKNLRWYNILIKYLEVLLPTFKNQLKSFGIFSCIEYIYTIFMIKYNVNT